jgi:uncharacterized SAM-binding protein YcdF (DUF218 family)
MTLSSSGMIVVLGSMNSEEGKLFSVGKERCGVALAEYGQRPGWKLLVTGGYGAHFNVTDRPHAAYVKDYLVEQGVPGEAFLEFAESRNTVEDAALVKDIVLKYGTREMVVVTSDYHLERAQYLFERAFAGTGMEIEFLSSETDEDAYPFDLQAQKKHERESLARLRDGNK